MVEEVGSYVRDWIDGGRVGRGVGVAWNVEEERGERFSYDWADCCFYVGCFHFYLRVLVCFVERWVGRDDL